jgi:hypothetical protein
MESRLVWEEAWERVLDTYWGCTRGGKVSEKLIKATDEQRVLEGKIYNTQLHLLRTLEK